jgi:hypothetical protein
LFSVFIFTGSSYGCLAQSSPIIFGGYFGLFFGLIWFGIGVVPVAIFASIIHGARCLVYAMGDCRKSCSCFWSPVPRSSYDEQSRADQRLNFSEFMENTGARAQARARLFP